MQAAIATKPFAASGACATRSSSSSRAVLAVRAAAGQQGEEAVRLPRRSLAGLLAAAPLLLSSRSALALIPDDDDEELVERARANRKAKLASERATEQAFARSSKNLDRVLEQELIPVQRAINTLAQSGSQLEAGDVKAAASTLSGGFKDFKAAAEKLSYTDDAKSSAAAVFTSLSALESAASKGSAKDAKQSFVAAVSALQTWATAAGVASSVKGL